MQRAFSVIKLQKIDANQRIITGLATSPETDRAGDVVEPNGAKYKLPMPLLLGHDASKPIGHVRLAKMTTRGIEIVAQIAHIAEAGAVKDRVDNAWVDIKNGLMGGLSIGFNALQAKRNADTGGLRFTEWNWMETSVVVLPCNESATIESIKHYDARPRVSAVYSLKLQRMVYR